jgi:hypothetical protein
MEKEEFLKKMVCPRCGNDKDFFECVVEEIC